MQGRLCGEQGHDISTGQTLSCPGALGLFPGSLLSKLSVPGTPAESPMESKWHTRFSRGQRVDGSVTSGQERLHQSRQLFLFGFQLQSFSLS